MTERQDHLVDARQLARLLGVAATWLKSEAEAGRLPHLRAGRQYFFDEQVIRAELLRRAREPEGQGRERE